MTEIRMVEVVAPLNSRSDLGRVIIANHDDDLVPRYTGSIFMCRSCSRAFLKRAGYERHRDSGECRGGTPFETYLRTATAKEDERQLEKRFEDTLFGELGLGQLFKSNSSLSNVNSYRSHLPSPKSPSRSQPSSMAQVKQMSVQLPHESSWALSSSKTIHRNTLTENNDLPINKKKVLTCDLCKVFKASQKRNLEKHQAFAHLSSGYSCRYCTCIFGTMQARNQHEHKYHASSLSQTNEETEVGQVPKTRKKRTKYKCNKCDRFLTSKRCLERHQMAAHVADGKFPCPHCPCIFRLELSYKNHLSTFHKTEAQAKLPAMSKEHFVANWVKEAAERLKSDDVDNTDIFDEKNPQQEVEAPDISDLDEERHFQSVDGESNRHRKSESNGGHTDVKFKEIKHSSNDLLTCKLCGISCHSQSELELHAKNSHVIWGVECPCGCSFATATELTRHKLKECPQRSNGLIEDNKVDEKCSSRLQNQNNSASRRTLSRSRCDQCGRTFEGRVNFVEHRRSCKPIPIKLEDVKIEMNGEPRLPPTETTAVPTPSKTEAVECPKCKRMFKNGTGLRAHILYTHSKTMKGSFTKCGICNYHTGNYANYAYHMKACHVKNGIKCSECVCSFRSVIRLSRHFKIHKSKTFDQTLYELRCDDCDFVTLSSAELTRHIKASHSNLKDEKEPKVDLKCNLCEFKLRNASDLKRHLIINHHKGGFQCKHCPCSFATVIGRQVHTNMWHRQEETKSCSSCEICGQFTPNIRVYKLHKKRAHVPNGLPCPHCPCALKDPSGLYRHVSSRHKRRINLDKYKHKCDRCKFITHSSELLEAHKINHEKRKASEARTEKVEKELVDCHLCGFKIANSIEDHISKAHVEGGHACSHCKCSFGTEMGLTRHMKIKHDIRVLKQTTYDPSVFPLSCSRCSFRSKTRHGLYLHSMKIHGMELPKLPAVTHRVCKVCNMTFTESLAAHQNRYHVLNGFKCPHCSCSFETHHSRVRHMVKTHNVVKSAHKLCRTCGFTFLGTYKDHNETCHVNGGIPCHIDSCCCSFKSEKAMIAHCQRRHQKVVPRGSKPKLLQCELCNVYLKESLGLHNKRCHVEGGIQCKLCCCSFATEKSLYIHNGKRHGRSLNASRKEGSKLDKSNRNDNICQLCGIQFRSEMDHMNTYHVKDGLKCSKCDCAFKTEGVRTRHLIRHHKIPLNQLKKCGLCGLRIYGTPHQHMLTNHVKNGYECPHCSCKLRTKEGRKKHILYQHKGMPLEVNCIVPTNACRLCGIEVAERLEDHIRRCHCVTNTFSCSNCNCRFSTKNGLTTHFLTHHKKLIKKTSPIESQHSRNANPVPEEGTATKQFTKPQLSSSLSNCSADLEQIDHDHQSSVEVDVDALQNPTHSNKTYQSESSKKENANVIPKKENSDVKSSSVRQTPTPTQKLTCLHCGYVAKCLSFLNMHIQKSHVKNSPFPCTQCSCGYSTEGELLRHVKIFHPIRNVVELN